MPPSPEKLGSALDAFLAAFRADIEAGSVRPLGEYLVRFPGDDKRIAREYLAIEDAAKAEPSADRIAHYKIIRQIGRGGQATVYLAEDPKLRRQVALKVLEVGPAANNQAIERFRREAAITSKLDHPGICPVYDIGQDRSVLYIAMRYVEGETLATRIAEATTDGDGSMTVDLESEATDRSQEKAGPRTSTPPRIAETIAIFEQAARALHVAHEHGVIHRDIKPGNLMVTKAGVPVLLDFGLAQEAEGGDVSLTLTGDMTGTPAYMSPEQLTAHRIRLDRRTDVYSLGVTLYEALTLRRPFEAPTREGLYKQILTKDPPDARGLNRHISSDLLVVLNTALEKDQDRRYQTALDLAEELRRVRMHEPIVAKPVGPVVRLARWAQRSPALAAAVGGLFAAISIGLVVALILLNKSERERVAKETALEEKANALAEVTRQRNENEGWARVGEITSLRALVEQSATFWPVEPSKAAVMKAWVAQAKVLVDRLPGHKRFLEKLRDAALPLTDEDDVADPSWRRNWKFALPVDQLKYNTAAQLVSELSKFANQETGTFADVGRRLGFAESYDRDLKSAEQETVGRYATRWTEAIRTIADKTECPSYSGLRITPQPGLIPIGKDPSSGLYEFVHYQTTSPGMDPIPVRGQDGRLGIAESTGLVFVLLPGGTFRMGSRRPDGDHPIGTPNVDPEAGDDESPVKDVTLDPFFLSKYEMTRGQWRRATGSDLTSYGAFREAEPESQSTRMRLPIGVRWIDCATWFPRLGLVLPTEAQWEYAARGGTTTVRWTGDGTQGLWGAANAPHTGSTARREVLGIRLRAVGSLLPNQFGLHDVLGNLQEWCRDDYTDYEVEPRVGDGLRGSEDLSAPDGRVARGGCIGGGATAQRSAVRNGDKPGHFRGGNFGVRPARRLVRAD
jgi:serine/threonine protein kinase/formylglycine-generating enzyme required for sulfatase activity